MNGKRVELKNFDLYKEKEPLVRKTVIFDTLPDIINLCSGCKISPYSKMVLLKATISTLPVKSSKVINFINFLFILRLYYLRRLQAQVSFS